MNASATPCLMLLALAQTTLHAQFRFHDLNEKSLELLDGGSPVFVYNRGMILKLSKTKPLVLKYRVTLLAGAPPEAGPPRPGEP